MPETTPAQTPGPIRGLRAGLAGWLVFGVALVAVRGVRWDENYEFAQVLIGEVKYPPWHPIAYWVHHALTGQLYLNALLMEWSSGPFIANAVRNVFFVWATVLPPFLLGTALGRSALAGHIAAVLMLAGVTLDFDASYPQFILPGMFSNGHVGMGFALIAVATLALGRPVLAFFLIGLMPAIHIGQTPQMILFVGFLLLARRLHPQPTGTWRRADLALITGFVTSAAILAAGFFAWHDSSLVAPTAASAHDVHTIWAGWVSFHDMHRNPPGILAVVLTAAFVLFAYLTMLGLGFAADRTKFAWPIAVVYVSGTLLIVLGVMHVQTLLEARIPAILLTWLPYRLWNHLPPVFVAGIAAVMVSQRNAETERESPASTVCLVAALSFLAVQPALRLIAPAEFAARYLSSSSPVLFFLLGALFTLAIPQLSTGRRSLRRITAFIAMAMLFSLALIHQFGTICVVAGALIALLMRRMRSVPALQKYQTEFVAALLVVIAAQITALEFIHREKLPKGDFERAAASYLSEQGEPDALLAPPMGQVLLQAQTGHPVLTDLATPFYIGYRPSIGPQINTLYRDVYGMDFRFPTPGRLWKQVWIERDPDEWRSLGAKYDFRYVVAPDDVVLPLHEAFSLQGRTLYRIDTDR